MSGDQIDGRSSCRRGPDTSDLTFPGAAEIMAENAGHDKIAIIYSDNAPGQECWADTQERFFQYYADQGVIEFLGIPEAPGDPSDNDANVQLIADFFGDTPPEETGIFFGIAAAGDFPERNGHFGFWSVLPPAVAIILAFATREVISSLFIGIALGGVIVTGSEDGAQHVASTVPVARTIEASRSSFSSRSSRFGTTAVSARSAVACAPRRRQEVLTHDPSGRCPARFEGAQLAASERVAPALTNCNRDLWP